MDQVSSGSTAVVSVRPNTDVGVIELRDEILKVRGYALIRTVTSIQDAEMATNDLSIMGQLKKRLGARKNEYVGPLQGYIKDVNDAFKLLSEPLAEADRITEEGKKS